jgi:hypothetical protein
MLGLCNSRVLEFYWRQVSTPLRGGFFRYFSQFIEQLPVADSNRPQRELVALLSTCLVWINRYFASHTERQDTRDLLMQAYWEEVLNGLVYELYFPEEVHGAGLGIFDLVEKAKPPNIEKILEKNRLPRLRKLFEELYDGHHPLKRALDKLQTVETVRIIEGKV